MMGSPVLLQRQCLVYGDTCSQSRFVKDRRHVNHYGLSLMSIGSKDAILKWSLFDINALSTINP